MKVGKSVVQFKRYNSMRNYKLNTNPQYYALYTRKGDFLKTMLARNTTIATTQKKKSSSYSNAAQSGMYSTLIHALISMHIITRYIHTVTICL